MPAPDKFAVSIISPDHGVALLDLGGVVAVGTDVERRLAVLEVGILHESRCGLPYDVHIGSSQLGTVALARGVDQVVRFGFRDDVTVGHLGADVLRRHDTGEERRRNERPAGGVTRKGERAGLDGIPALDVLGRRSLDGDHRACQVNDRLVPTGGFARRGQCLDVLCRETDRSRPSGLRKEHRRGIERDLARILILAACHDENRRSHDHSHQPYESFHITQIYRISI
ncbi:Uncharacterised protein [Alistipes finegoldii]|nr:Uncharacterised protein [Alistipes finegoldii]